MKNDKKSENVMNHEGFSGVSLGGLGTGSVELRADGKFHEWQIFNNWGTISQSTRGKTQVFKLDIRDGNFEIKRLSLLPFVVKKKIYS